MILVLIAVAIIIAMLKSVVKPNNYPPGPNWYPIIGSSNIAQYMSKKHGSQFRGMLELAKTYSTQVLGLKLGSEQLVIVYGLKNVQKVLNDSNFDARPWSFFAQLRCLGKKMGITFTDGPLWKAHRNFTVKQLKNVGFGKTEMEREIQKKLNNLKEYIKLHNSKALNPNKMLSVAVMNILWKYVAGEDIEKNQLKLLLELFNKRSKAFSMAGGLLNQAPWTRFILPKFTGYSLILQINRHISSIIDEAIQKHKNHSVEGKDFMYSFLEEMKKGSYGFCEEQLKITCLDLFIAGTQTSGSTLEFALQTALRYPRMQEKIYEEIRTVLGEDTPCWTDSDRLIYTYAFLLEVQRYFPIAPLLGPRRALQDAVIDGYHIPKDATVLISIGDLNFDPDCWANPHEFLPERFIDGNGNLKYAENFYPFGSGRRRCPGDSLAKSFVFITFVGILQKFRIEGTDGLPSEASSIGLLASPYPYAMKFVDRNKSVQVYLSILMSIPLLHCY